MTNQATFRTTIGRIKVKDGLANFEARIGLGTDNQSSSTRYTFRPLTRDRAELDNMYRSSWIVRQAVGVIADDMTRAGVTIQGLREKGDVDRLVKAMRRMGFWQDLGSAIRWGRLYGGAIAVMLVEGQKLDQPLRPETVGRQQLKGIVVLDRWSLTPSSALVSAMGPDFGKPEYYSVVVSQNTSLPSGDIHHTRVMRLEGDDLPYFQRRYEMGWGMSVVEPFHDRLVAFDSTTQGTAQMVFRAHLRILKMLNLRKSIADGGRSFESAVAQIDMMRRYQTLEGISLIDSQDDFQTTSYAFAGLPDVLVQMSQQIAGATGIPIVKLFGMSPAGFSTGETDLRSYYDNILLRQEKSLRRPLEVFLSMLHRSELGVEPAPDFGFEFATLWGMTSVEKAQVAAAVVNSVVQADSAQIIRKGVALRELRNSSAVTGVFESITDEDVEQADREDAEPVLPETPMPGVTSLSGDDDQATEALAEPEEDTTEGDRPDRSRPLPGDDEPTVRAPSNLRRISGGRA